jgi:NADH pyrophosphatase NudC (nudix superfamily)
MDIGSIFLILALLTLVVLLVGRPLFNRQNTTVFELTDREDHDYSTLLAERDRVLLALEELDFDNSMGKIPEEDYPSQRALLLQYGSDILRKLDEFTVAGKQAREDKEVGESPEARLEATLAEKRITRSAPAAVGSAINGGEGADDDLEVLIASRRRARNVKSAGFCPQCGGPLQKSDRFCPKCGATV